MATKETLVRQMFGAGALDPEILKALDFPIARDTLRFYRKKWGLCRVVTTTPISEEECAAVEALLDAPGMTPTKIQKKLGMAPTRFRNLCIKYGLESKKYDDSVKISPEVCGRWSALLKDRRFSDGPVARESYLRMLPPATHVHRESTAAMAAL